MLVLTRKVEEKTFLILPNEQRIEIKILGVHRDGSVKLGIQAPNDVTILRKEVEDRITQEK